MVCIKTPQGADSDDTMATTRDDTMYGAQNEAYKWELDEMRGKGLRDKGLGRLRSKRRKKRNVYMGLILVYVEGWMRLG